VTLTILDDSMSSDLSPHTARRAPYMPSLWEVSWLPGRSLGRNEAITAMVLADTTASGDIHQGDKLWAQVWGWAAELRLSASDAITKEASPPRWAGKDDIWEFLHDADRTDPFGDLELYPGEPGWPPDPTPKTSSQGILHAVRGPQPEPGMPADPEAGG
jgi:hypothetical protein